MQGNIPVKHAALSWPHLCPLVRSAEGIRLWNVYFVFRSRRSRVKAFIGRLRKAQNSINHNALKVIIDLLQGIRVAKDGAQSLSHQRHCLNSVVVMLKTADSDNSTATTSIRTMAIEGVLHSQAAASFEAEAVASWERGLSVEQIAPGTVTGRL